MVIALQVLHILHIERKMIFNNESNLFIVGDHERFCQALRLIVTRAWANRIDMAPVGFGLWVHFGISIDLGNKETSPTMAGQTFNILPRLSTLAALWPWCGEQAQACSLPRVRWFLSFLPDCTYSVEARLAMQDGRFDQLKRCIGTRPPLSQILILLSPRRQ